MGKDHLRLLGFRHNKRTIKTKIQIPTSTVKNLYDQEDVMRTVTNNRHKGTQSTSVSVSFQYRASLVHQSTTPAERKYDFVRHERCIFSHPNLSTISEILEVRYRRPSISVPCNGFQVLPLHNLYSRRYFDESRRDRLYSSHGSLIFAQSDMVPHSIKPSNKVGTPPPQTNSY